MAIVIKNGIITELKTSTSGLTGYKLEYGYLYK